MELGNYYIAFHNKHIWQVPLVSRMMNKSLFRKLYQKQINCL